MSKFFVPSLTLEVPGTDFKLKVRGLSFNHMVALVADHKALLIDLYKQLTEKQTFSDGDIGSLMSELICEAPGLVAHAIALSAGMPDEKKEFEDLPFTVQLEALEAIFTLTFGRAGGGKKFVEMATRIANSLTAQVKNLTKA